MLASGRFSSIAFRKRGKKPVSLYRRSVTPRRFWLFLVYGRRVPAQVSKVYDAYTRGSSFPTKISEFSLFSKYVLFTENRHVYIY